jgi:hypothetical protein
VQVVVYFWHGNAEVCTNVDHVKDVFLKSNAAVLSLDYRGYSWGTGQPSLTKLCSDAEECFAASIPLLEKAGCGAAKRVAMGRSIGATCAVHLAANRASKFHGLVVDSGLMSVKGLPMVAQMGPMLMGGPQMFAALPEPFDTLGKLPMISCPALVMHGRRDEIVPYSQAVECHKLCAGQDKVFKEWANAGHNDVGLTYENEWAKEIGDLIRKAAAFSEPFPAGAVVEASGAKGRILGPSNGRYRVDFDAPTGVKEHDAKDLSFLEPSKGDAFDGFPIETKVEAHSLSSAEMNGMKGSVVGFKGERINVAFGGATGTKALKPVNLKIVSE